MTFGSAQRDFFINNPEAVAQSVMTRLLLLQGEWYLDTTEGMPWATEVLGVRTTPTYDAAIRARIMETTGVKSMINYASSLRDRNLVVSAQIDTIYGPTTIQAVL